MRCGARDVSTSGVDLQVELSELAVDGEVAGGQAEIGIDPLESLRQPEHRISVAAQPTAEPAVHPAARRGDHELVAVAVQGPAIDAPGAADVEFGILDIGELDPDAAGVDLDVEVGDAVDRESAR